jgi:DNA uptake protein ComE-like DNA-binding protein
MRTRRSLIARRTAGVGTALLIVAACSSGTKDAARTDSVAGAAAGSTAEMQSGTSVPSPGAPIVDSATAAPAASASGATAASGTMLDPNSATREQLAAVPGMSAAAADAVIAGRPYQDMLAVDKVLAKSIPSADTRKTVYAKVWKPIDLNTAKGEEILLIPGIGKRMQHEFEEYRPYKSIDQFRREIGKYVDKAEVARLEQYVTIR